MKQFSVYRLLRGMLWGVSLAAVYFIFLLNFIYSASVSYDAAEKEICDQNHNRIVSQGFRK